MVEIQGQPQNLEQEQPSKIAEKFAAARDTVMQEATELKQIYKSIQEPGVKDVYNSWVRNMDVVANAQSLGREKPRLRTKIMKVANRIVGIGAATLTGALDLIPDALTWLPRKVPVIRHFIPHDVFKRHTMRMAEKAKKEALSGQVVGGFVVRGLDNVAGNIARARDAAFHPFTNSPDKRAAGQYLEKKVLNITEAIMHPKPKAPMKA